MLKDLTNEDDWGLEGFEGRMQPRTSLIEEIMAEEQLRDGEGLSVSSTGQVGQGNPASSVGGMQL